MELEKVLEKIKEVGLKNNDLTKYGDGFEYAIHLVKIAIEELYNEETIKTK